MSGSDLGAGIPLSSLPTDNSTGEPHAPQDGSSLEHEVLPRTIAPESQTIEEPMVSESATNSSQTSGDPNQAAMQTGQAATQTDQAATQTGQAAANPGEPPETHASSNRDTHGIYLKSPILMGSSWILGAVFSLGHHLFYKHFDGSIVGSTNEEQWNIRVGSFFALLVKILLMSSVWFAYTQWLWRTLRSREISLKGIDAAFSVETSMFALLNLELILKVRIGAVLALIAWCLQVPPLITPATLFVVPGLNITHNETGVLSLDITNAASANYFAYFIPMNDTGNYPNANNQSQSFDGPRSISTRLSTASASLGQILPITPPFSNCSYPLNFSAPYVNCTAANSTVEFLMDAFLHEMNSTWEESGLAFIEAYYALVPSHDANVDNATTILYDGTNYTALDQPRLQERPMNATNELWMKFYRYSVDANGDHIVDSNENPVVTPNYSVCSLWNASYELEFSFENGVQTVQNNSIKLLNPVDYPINNPNEPSDPVQLAYSALFIVLTDQLVGYMGIFINSTTSSPQYGSIDTNIEHNSLLGSNDLDYFFYLNSLITNSNETMLSPQRLLDKALAQNETLPVLAQQLSFNVTVSLMNDPLLAPQVTANVAQTIPVNRYSYDVRNLWLAYGLAIFFTFCAVVLGLIAFISNNASHDNAVSTLLSIGRDPSLDPLFPPCCHGRLPLPRETMNALLKVMKQDNGEENLKPPPGVKIQPSCQTCAARVAAAASPRPEQRRESMFARWISGRRPTAPEADGADSV